MQYVFTTLIFLVSLLATVLISATSWHLFCILKLKQKLIDGLFFLFYSLNKIQFSPVTAADVNIPKNYKRTIEIQFLTDQYLEQFRVC